MKIKVTKLTDPISNGGCNGFWIGCPREAVYLLENDKNQYTLKACESCATKHLEKAGLSQDLLK